MECATVNTSMALSLLQIIIYVGLQCKQLQIIQTTLAIVLAIVV